MTSDSMRAEADLDLSAVDRIVAAHEGEPRRLIAMLQAIQAHFRYLPDAALERVCLLTSVSPARITGVATFYGQFRRRPMGRHLIRVCHGTACHVAGAPQITDALRRELGIEGDNDTDRNLLFTVQKVACLGCCSLAPCLMIDEVTYGRLTARTAPRTLAKFLEEHGS